MFIKKRKLLSKNVAIKDIEQDIRWDNAQDRIVVG